MGYNPPLISKGSLIPKAYTKGIRPRNIEKLGEPPGMSCLRVIRSRAHLDSQASGGLSLEKAVEPQISQINTDYQSIAEFNEFTPQVGLNS
jgi:hypothetical protein